MTSRRSYFPKANHLFKRSDSDSPSLPRRPSRIAPIFDQDHADQPLPPFDERQHAINYAEDSTDPYTTPLPPEPADLSTPYLYPTLSRNERLRLTMLWYYTKDIADDEELLQKLQGIIRLVRSFIGWEYVIMGILSENTYHRLVTHGVPLAMLPRRESTCAHTINQKFGVSPPSPFSTHANPAPALRSPKHAGGLALPEFSPRPGGRVAELRRSPTALRDRKRPVHRPWLFVRRRKFRDRGA